MTSSNDGFVVVAAAERETQTPSGYALVRPAYSEREIAESIRETCRRAPLVRSSTANREPTTSPRVEVDPEAISIPHWL
jgi:hypothetical protein